MDMDVQRLKESSLGRRFGYKGFLPIGSWGLNVYASKEYYTEVLGHHFKQNVTANPLSPSPGGSLYMIDSPRDSDIFRRHEALEDNSVAEWEGLDGGVSSISTGRFQVLLYKDENPPLILIFVREPQYSREAFHGHVFEIIHKILFSLDRFYIHAAALELGGRVSAFIGDKGAGKSTVTLMMAREGARILSDDHVVFRKGDGGFLVSGCEDRGRVTGETEKAVFDRRLDQKAERFGGVLKKEIMLGDYFECAHFTDFPLDNIFFLRVGDDFRIAPVSRREAVLNLIEKTKPFFRSNAGSDFGDYLTYFSELTGSAAVYDLELSKDLADLKMLADFLRTK